jgi:hypothetical protein
MDSSFAEWVYLKQIVGNFDGLVQFYYGSMSFFAPSFRQGAVGLLYGLGLAWAGFCFFKAPIDKLKSGAGVMLMVFAAGFLVSPTTNTKYLGGGSTELSVGGYYAYVAAGSITQVFSNVLVGAWKNSLNEVVGGGSGPTKDAIAMAFNNKAGEFADKFLKGEGNEAVKDYYQKCGSEALKVAKNNKDKTILRSIGIGANTLGMASADATTMTQLVAQANNRNSSLSMLIANGSDDQAGMNLYEASKIEAKDLDQNRSEAEEYLKNLPSANSNIDGTKGYKIPTSAYFKEQLGAKQGDTSTADSFKKISGSDSKLAAMLPNGATTVSPGSEEDYKFYPKNCYDLYQVANQTMGGFRDGVKGVPGYENMGLTGSYVSMVAGQAVRRGINDQTRQDIIAAGGDPDSVANEGFLDSMADLAHAGGSAYSNWFDKWMLEYKIPAMISGMAMLTVILVVTFPIFAMISVLFGPQVLATYFKLMALPFLVVFTNSFLLSVSANLIAYGKAYAVLPDTFNAGGVDVPSAISSMNTETIIFSVICICEIAIAKFILWNDVKAITNFNAADVGVNAAARGASMIGKIMSLAGGALGRGAKLASAAKSAESAQSTSASIAHISQMVSTIANGGQRGRRPNASLPGQPSQASSPSPQSPSGGSPGGGGGSPGSGGNQGSGGNTLNPTPKPKP